ncbi:putative disease resistance protein RGA3 [Papaver somniferum]|uniref:putative disease resistance protein RGA3 n=1 Tax=Papaver somniferum TaxID=3469 RepID=UPI000E7009CB|nr:putative disease resistance protein RGA3 [Papaver somniferum]
MSLKIEDIDTKLDELASDKVKFLLEQTGSIDTAYDQNTEQSKAFSFGGAIETPAMTNIGQEIATKCAGLPLAANFLGSLMRLKKTELEWLSIRDNDILNTPENQNKTNLILKLSFDNLPSHLKQCFSYCCVFPKGWEIKRETLIQLWMAEGFIQPSHRDCKRSIEDIGNDYFQNLLSSSFFQDVEKDKLGDI